MDYKDLDEARVAILATDGFEESELITPMKHWFRLGADLDIIAPHSGRIRGMRHMDKGRRVNVTHVLEDAHAEDYDALLIPGGLFSPDALRTDVQAIRFVREFERSRKPIAAICHGPQVLISAGLTKARVMTGYKSIRADIENSGAKYLDEAVVRDDNWISSRSPDDLPFFVDAVADLIAEYRLRTRMVG